MDSDRSAERDEPRVVILAAGASSRLGEPKALVDFGGEPAVSRLARMAGGREPALVVTGAHHGAIAAAALGGVELLHNERWSAGRTGGLALAARHCAGRDLLIAPVDVPLVPAEVFDRLRAAWSEAGRPPHGWLAPRVACGPAAGRFGHPLVLGSGLAAELSRSDPDRPLVELRRQASPLLAVDVSTDAILDDLDTPDDLDALRSKLAAGERG